MDTSTLIMLAAIVGFAVLLLFGIAALITKFYVKVEQGKALIINRMGDRPPIVTFTGGVVWPIVNKAEVMDISLKTIEIDRHGKDGLICKDNIRADIQVTFFVRVNKNDEDVLKVAHSIGCNRASDPETLKELFTAKFSEALKSVGKQLDFVDLYQKRDQFRTDITESIGEDLNGYVLEDAAIDYLEQTPLEQLDPQNILDAQGIRKITELTATEHVATNIARREEELKIKEKDVRTREQMLELEKQENDAIAKQKREVATIRAREEAEIVRVTAEERQKAESARIKTDEQLAIAEENKGREVEVAHKNRERAVAIEEEKVKRARDLESIAREREVELERISKEKALEIERKEIADVVRERVAVERTVADEEEQIKDLRVKKEAERQKSVKITLAEAEAEEMLVKDIKKAEAQKTAASHRAVEINTMAQAELDAADKKAKAKVRLAEGVQAEAAAPGLAEVKVKEADAHAIEKQGLAQARVKLESYQAEAQGEEQKGMARVRVQQAEAETVQKLGLAEATVNREKLLAQAQGEEEQGMARVRVNEGEAQVIEKRGIAEATAIREKQIAEATGLVEKFNAMKQMDDKSRAHEEYRLQLDQLKVIELETIGARKQVAEAQARILSEAFKNANIDIVGGDGAFFDRMVNAISVTKSLDGFVRNGETAKTLLKDYLSGKTSLPQDLKDVLSRPALGAGEVQQLTLSAFLGHLMSGGDDAERSRIGQLLEYAKKLGVAELPLAK
ncbi:MAG: hypothetical protein KC609_24515 [Myxococcales bacterium]|nr:hypothetical protein [Myxococcales bacterium]